MERLRVSEQKWARVRRAVHGGGRRVPPDTPCSSRPPPCTWSTAAAAEPAQRGTRRFRTQSRRARHCHTRARLRRPRAWRRRQSFWASQGLAPPPASQAVRFSSGASTSIASGATARSVRPCHSFSSRCNFFSKRLGPRFAGGNVAASCRPVKGIPTPNPQPAQLGVWSHNRGQRVVAKTMPRSWSGRPNRPGTRGAAA